MSNSSPIFRAFIFLTTLLLPLPASAFNTKHLSKNDDRRLKAGEVLVDVKPAGSSAAIVSAAIDIPANREIVWSIMTDCERSPQFIPDLKSCRVLKRRIDGKGDIREHIVSWGMLLPNVRSVFRSEYQQPESIRFEKVGGDFSELSGEWRLDRVGKTGATRIIYEAKVSIPLLVPTSLVRSAIETDIPKTLKALRDEVNRNGRQ